MTGHRTFDDPDAVAAAVDVVLDRIADHGGVDELWTSLAEGADRFVVERVLGRWPTAAVVAVLPLPVDDYATDFTDPNSREAFLRLVDAADRVDVVPPPADASREAAYEAAGFAVVDACDVVIALWDGQPARGRGGTAEVIAHALAADVLVEAVMVTRPP